MFHGGVHYGTGATVVQGGDGMHLFKSKGREVVNLIGDRCGVGLVGDEVDWLSGLMEVAGNLLIEGDDALANVDHQQNHVGGLNGDGGLVDGGGDDYVVGFLAGHEADAAGIDEREGAAQPLDLGADTVAGDAGPVVNDGDAAAGDAVEKRGLADIGSADDGDDSRVTHSLFTISFRVRAADYTGQIWKNGDPYGTRTRVAGVKGQCPNH